MLNAFKLLMLVYASTAFAVALLFAAYVFVGVL